MASKLRTVNSRLEVSATRSHIASRLRCTHQWRTRQLSNGCLSWRLARSPAVSYHFITEPDSQQVAGSVLLCCCTTVKGYLCFTVCPLGWADISARHVQRVKYFSNNRSIAFDFAENKPTLIWDVSNVRQSASQIITLTKFLPLIIGDRILLQDKHWISFQVLKICRLALSPTFTHDNIAYLSVLIEEKLTLFCELHTDVRLIPKQHYMVHYPSQIKAFGPLLHTWTMRQESKAELY